jgi:hypothetical protein
MKTEDMIIWSGLFHTSRGSDRREWKLKKLGEMPAPMALPS